MERRAKIMATLGPASSSDEVVAEMLRSGLDLVRLNLSHGTHDTHRELIRTVRRQAERLGRFIPIVLDLMGPRYRLGEIPGDHRQLREGETIRLVARAEDDRDLPLGRAELLDHLREGERVLLDAGLVELRVIEVPPAGSSRGRGETPGVTARVLHGGPVSSRKGINLPDSTLPFEISDKDRDDVAFAVEERLDYLAASYVDRADDLDALREIARAAGDELPLIAKLERQGSIDRLDELVDASDALMVARGDLGVEVPLHRVPVLQKEIIAAGRRQGKPVIVATQMLESMMGQPRPTRAEASDVANAVFDGADALMLSGETAAGDFPVAAIQVMARIIGEAEAYERRARSRARPPGPSAPFVATGAPPSSDRRAEGPAGSDDEGAALLAIAEVVSAAAVYAADRLPVRQIIAFSQGGFTARMVARSRPEAPVLVFTTDPRVARRIQLVWGVRPLLMDAELEHHDEVVDVVELQLLEAGLADPGETIVILMGDPIHERPLTNLLRVHRLRAT
ncbi:MAG: pyruvate kinase [Acidobacteriota bacterium]|jgi:pyruvate kinase